MEIKFDRVSVIYPNENSPELRNITVATDGEYLQINILDDTLNSVGITLYKNEVEILSDALKLILKNKLIKDFEDD